MKSPRKNIIVSIELQSKNGKTWSLVTYEDCEVLDKEDSFFIPRAKDLARAIVALQRDYRLNSKIAIEEEIENTTA